MEQFRARWCRWQPGRSTKDTTNKQIKPSPHPPLNHHIHKKKTHQTAPPNYHHTAGSPKRKKREQKESDKYQNRIQSERAEYGGPWGWGGGEERHGLCVDFENGCWRRGGVSSTLILVRDMLRPKCFESSRWNRVGSL